MKYQRIQREGSHVQRAVHTRIKREVWIYEFPGELNLERRQFLKVASNLASLDHPQIPHLIDVQEAAGTFCVVVEALSTTSRLPPTEDLLEHAHRLERISDALAHAHERGIAHGELSADHLVLDSEGQLQLLGIGIHQMRSAVVLSALIERDHIQLSEWVQATLPRAAIAPEGTADPRKFIEFESFADKLLLGAKEPGRHTMRRFHRKLRSWLAQELATRERQLLSVAEPQASLQLARTWTARQSAITACLGLATVGLTATGLFVWEGNGSVDVPPDYWRKTSGQGRGARVVKPAEIAENPVDLSTAGTINSRGSSAKSETMVAATPRPTSTRGDQTGPTASAPTNRRPEPSDEQLTPEESASESQTMTAVPQLSWGKLPRAIALPDSNSASLAEILTGVGVDGLELSLLGGDAAVRQGTFSIRRESSAAQWVILFERQDATSIASIEHVPNALQFRWAPAAVNISAAKYLCNTVLRLTSGEQTARVALRQATTIAALPAALTEGISRHKLPLDLTPSYADIFVEFLPPDDGLTVPITPAIVPAVEGELRLGLEARHNSLFLVQVKSRLRRRQALELVPYSRLQIGDTPRPLTPAAIQQFRQEMLMAKQTVFAGKAALSGMKRGKRKTAARARLRKLEAHVKALAEFAEAFDAANDVDLRFRVFRRIDDMEVDLLHAGEISSRSNG